MSHKPYSGLAFTNSVPKFLQAAVAKHGLEKNRFIAKKFVTEDGNEIDGDNDNDKDVINNSSDSQPEKLENGDRKDTEFEKPIIVNVDDLNNLNMEQREQLNDIMRKSQLEDVKNANNDDINEEDEDIFIAKKVMRFASMPSQNIIGMNDNKRKKPKFRFNKKMKSKSKDKSKSELGKRKLINHDEDLEDDEDGPPEKKRKIYQEMSQKQVKKQRKKKLKFKTDQNNEVDNRLDEAQGQSSMLSFDLDDDE